MTEADPKIRQSLFIQESNNEIKKVLDLNNIETQIKLQILRSIDLNNSKYSYNFDLYDRILPKDSIATEFELETLNKQKEKFLKEKNELIAKTASIGNEKVLKQRRQEQITNEIKDCGNNIPAFFRSHFKKICQEQKNNENKSITIIINNLNKELDKLIKNRGY